MNMKKTINIITTVFIAVFSVGILATAATTPVNAADDTCGGVKVSYLGAICNDSQGGGGGDSKDIGNSGLWKILTGVLNIMIAGVGILAVGGIVYGAILYASAQDNQSQVQKAIEIFRNVTIGLVSFALMYSLLQFIIVGGVF